MQVYVWTCFFFRERDIDVDSYLYRYTWSSCFRRERWGGVPGVAGLPPQGDILFILSLSSRNLFLLREVVSE